MSAPDWPEEATPRYYANFIRRISNLYDIALDFGYTATGEDPEYLCRVVLSWEEVRKLRDFLSDDIAGYEEHVGSIREFKPATEFPPADDASNGHNVAEDDDA